MIYKLIPIITISLFLAFSISLKAQNVSVKLPTTNIIGTNECINYAGGNVMSTTVNTKYNAFDGNLNNTFAAYQASGGWVGLDLGEKYIITKISYCPRTSWSQQMMLGIFEGANNPDFGDAVPLFMITQNPQQNILTEQGISCSRGFRYVRYIGPSGAHSDVAELGFYGYKGIGDNSNLPQITNLPTVTIHTANSEDIVEKEKYLKGIVSVISQDGTQIYTDSLDVRGRGNASWTFPKKPYRMKLYNKTNLLGCPAKEKNWTLINNYGDKTLMRNLLAFDLSRRLDMPYTSVGIPVDVILNGEYKGCYQLCDQIEVAKYRVDVETMKATDITLPNLSGGYFIEVDAYASQEISWFKSAFKSTPVTIKYPKDDEIVPAQSAYIKSVYDNMESVLFSSTYTNKTSGYRKYIDTETFIRHFLVGEISGNTDTYWSVYMYKKRNEDIFRVGPVWDFDLAYENDKRTYPINSNSNWIYASTGSCAAGFRDFVNRLFSDPDFLLEVKSTYACYRDRGILTKSALLDVVDEYAAELSKSQELNFKRWDIMNTLVHGNPKIYGSYEAEVNNVKNYISARLDWMDNKLGYTAISIKGEHVMHKSDPGNPSDTERMYIYPRNTYWYKWYDDPVSDDPSHLVAEGDYYDVHKNSAALQPYYIEVWDLTTKSKRIHCIRDTIRIYLAPDSLIWTGAAKDQNWNNHENWLNPDNLSGLYAQNNIPHKYTNVLIPAMVSNYPDLTPTTLGGHTDYSNYKRSECSNITFEHGGEVMRTDSLHYNAAYVHLTLNSNRWYMLSAPLRSLFPGDYYVKDPSPCIDDVFVYTRLYDKQNPQTGKYVAGNWTGIFNNPDYALPAGFGFSAWVDDKQPDVNIHTPIHFLFPKHDANYIMYNEVTCKPDYIVPISRNNEHRFVYEPVLNAMSGSITLNASATAAGTQVIVGNPFMAHLDFNQFQSLNTALIEPYYQVLDENGNFISYYITGGTTTGSLTQYIAPMQSVLVKSKIPFAELYANAKMTTTVPGEKLRTTTSVADPELLSIKVSKGNISNKSLLYYHPDFIPEEYVDVSKAFLNNITEPVTVYTLSQKGNLLDIQNVDDIEKPIFLGFRTSTIGDFEFSFEGINTFASDYNVYLTDMGEDSPIQVNLSDFPYYTFKKMNSNLFINDRFYLTFIQKSIITDVPNLESTIGIDVIVQPGKIKILSVDGSLLKDIGVYDLQGKTINMQKNIQVSQIELPVQNAGIYIVRASNANVSKSVRIYGK